MLPPQHVWSSEDLFRMPLQQICNPGTVVTFKQMLNIAALQLVITNAYEISEIQFVLAKIVVKYELWLKRTHFIYPDVFVMYSFVFFEKYKTCNID